ncbi:MAG: NUDIX hydrolase [Bryobacterales bacterium]
MGRRYPSQPVAGVGAIVLADDQVLLVRRGQAPQKGWGSIPGAVELGETLAEAVAREVREECGLEVRPGVLVEVFERILRDAEARVEYHYVLMDYLCELEGGTLRAGDDAADAAWVPLSQLDELAMTRGTPAVIRKAHAMRAQVSP